MQEIRLFLPNDFTIALESHRSALDQISSMMLECYQGYLVLFFRGRGSMYLEETLQTYLDDLASARPTPGGGSAAALSAATGAALACMVARLTLSKADYADVHVEIETLLQEAEKLRI